MSIPVTNVRRKRHDRIEVTVRVTPRRRGQSPRATITGHVRNGALVTANGIRWTFR